VSTNMGNLEKLGILVIVILVVVVGVVAITPKSTVDDRLYADAKPGEVVASPETLDSGVGGPETAAVPADPFPGKYGGTAGELKPLPTLDAPAVPTTRGVKVQQGDTPATIAKRELGSAARYQEILDANPGLVASKLVKGMEIKIPVGSTSPVASTGASGTPAPLSPATESAAGERTYVVKSGDTLSTIASREMGGRSRWPDLQHANEDVLHGSTALRIGMKLRIPVAGSSGGSSVVAARDPAASTGGTSAPSAGAEREYVVRSGDSLWGIAKSEMGSETFLKELKAANHDVLKGSDSLKVGMKLRIPARK
jgi:nucleoid-associated protein YgaU